jgi:beta-phosphoglucomutase-like phosphatase (HAD superfamily)
VINVDHVAEAWQLALDRAADALIVSRDTFAPPERELMTRRLREERRSIADELVDVARVDHVAAVPWLAPGRITNRMLALPPHIRACIFELDGVLTDSGIAHAIAWEQVFSDRGFDRDVDYRAYFDGRAPHEGIRMFLESRGVRVNADEARRLVNAKAAALERVRRRRGITARPGARRYLEAVGRAGLRRFVASESRRTGDMLALAGIDTLVESTASAPAVEVAVFTHTARGVATAVAAGHAVIGVGNPVLAAFGAQRTVSALDDLLDAVLR